MTGHADCEGAIGEIVIRATRDAGGILVEEELVSCWTDSGPLA